VIFWKKKWGKGKNSLLSSLTTCSQIWLFPPLDDLPCALHHKIQQLACPIIMAFTLAWIMNEKYSTYYTVLPSPGWIQQQNCRIIN